MAKENKTGKKPAAGTQRENGVFDGLSQGRKDILSIAFLFVVTLVLFYKIVFSNMIFSDVGDTATAQSWTKAAEHLESTEGADPLWMPYVFSGMPAFGSLSYETPFRLLGISATHSSGGSYIQGLIHIVGRLLYLNADDGWLVLHYFLAGLFMFLLARRWNFSQVPSLIAALVFMLCPYSIGLAGEGHGSKLMAVSYLPLIVLLTDLLLERRNMLSFGLFVAGVGTMLLTKHVQIVYYVFIVVGCWLLYQVALDFRENKLLALKKVMLFVAGLALAMGIASYIYLPVHEYAQFSIRGGGTEGTTGGLAWDYATNWSFHPFEMIDYLIPSFFGFQNYWGTMPFSNAAFYVGIVPVLLSLIVVFYKRTKVTMFFVVLTAIVFLISFGKHLPLLYGPMFDYLPYFDKFRAPSMILHLVAFTTAILGAFGYQYLVDLHDSAREAERENLRKKLLYCAGGLVALLLLGLMLKSSLYEWMSSFMFVKEGEPEQYQQQYGQQARQIIAQLKDARFQLLWSGFVKFVLISSISLGSLAMYLGGKIRKTLFAVLLLGIVFVDLFIVIKAGNYINPKPNKALEQAFTPDAKITFLKQQPGLFRVLPLLDLFGDNTYMYHLIQTAGGYSPAKLKIYQTMLDSCLYRGPDQEFPLNMNMVNMLNVEFILARGRLPEGRFELVNMDQASRVLTYKNPGMLPRAFFVKNAVVARSEQEVFRILNSDTFDVSKRAILEKPLAEPVTAPDSSSAQITEFKSGEVSIKAYTSSPALLVLGEIYYPPGWNAYVDGVKTEIFKTNYILRSILVPAGSHDVEFRYESASYATGWLISHSAWGLTALFILAGLWRTPAVHDRLFPSKTVKTT